MQHYLISLLIFIPLAAALTGLIIPSRFENAFRYLVVAVNLVQLFLFIFSLSFYVPDSGVQFV